MFSSVHLGDELFSYLFVLRDGAGVQECLHRRLAEAIAALMRPPIIVFRHPMIEILLQFADRRVDLLAEGDAIELVEHGLVVALDNSIYLRALGLRARMVDVFDGEIELVFVVFGIAQYSVPRSVRMRCSGMPFSS